MIFKTLAKNMKTLGTAIVFLVANHMVQSAASAGSFLVLDLDGLTSTDARHAQRWLRRSEGFLTDFMKQNLPQVRVKFVHLTNASSKLPLMSFCTGTPPNTEVVFGRTRANLFYKKTRTIEIEKGLLPWIASGETYRPEGFDCPHQTPYRLAMATLLHELTHVLDSELKISRDPDFLRLAGWSLQGLVFKRMRQSNYLRERSPDPCERCRPTEALAVNVEHFLLDSEYGARRPSLYTYLTQKLGFTRSIPIAPSVIYDLFLPNFGWYSLDITRVQGIDFVLSGPGKSAESRFGHALIRVIVCAPFRKRIGPDCRHDTAEHLVFGYEAAVDDVELSVIKGISGRYPSQLTSLKWSDKIKEVVDLENRTLQSFPLKIDQPEIDELLMTLLQEYWTYQGKYRFFSNNCATEASKTLGSLSGKVHSGLPRGLLKDLIKTSLVDAEQVQTLYPISHDLDSDLLAAGISTERVERLRRLSAAERRAWYLSVDFGTQEKLLTSFIKLETLFVRDLSVSIQKAKKKYLHECLQEKSHCSPKDQQLAARTVWLGQALRDLLPWRLMSHGYGVPLATELTPRLQKTFSAQHQKLANELKKITSELGSFECGESQAQLVSGMKNLAWLKKERARIYQSSSHLP